ncbi:basic proline-rich protein-like [Perognathus longimembris pacificus]|uniref:basic proline-rich protein-like n=1 Tax=Perognathus longimembris pacificus TaxID=214514 RepID=UPI002019185A|nr:basic proline-rich protein-like [Perognathus longimembris pacificus]
MEKWEGGSGVFAARCHGLLSEKQKSLWMGPRLHPQPLLHHLVPPQGGRRVVGSSRVGAALSRPELSVPQGPFILELATLKAPVKDGDECETTHRLGSLRTARKPPGAVQSFMLHRFYRQKPTGVPFRVSAARTRGSLSPPGPLQAGVRASPRPRPRPPRRGDAEPSQGVASAAPGTGLEGRGALEPEPPSGVVRGRPPVGALPAWACSGEREAGRGAAARPPPPWGPGVLVCGRHSAGALAVRAGSEAGRTCATRGREGGRAGGRESSARPPAATPPERRPAPTWRAEEDRAPRRCAAPPRPSPRSRPRAPDPALPTPRSRPRPRAPVPVPALPTPPPRSRLRPRAPVPALPSPSPRSPSPRSRRRPRAPVPALASPVPALASPVPALPTPPPPPPALASPSPRSRPCSCPRAGSGGLEAGVHPS